MVEYTSHPLVQQVLAGAKHKLSHIAMKEEPIMLEILATLIDMLGSEQASLSDICISAMWLVGYAGFSSLILSKMKESDMIFYKEIFVEWSKTDQLSLGVLTASLYNV